MAKAKKTKEKEIPLSIKGTFSDVIKVSLSKKATNKPTRPKGKE